LRFSDHHTRSECKYRLLELGKRRCCCRTREDLPDYDPLGFLRRSASEARPDGLQADVAGMPEREKYRPRRCHPLRQITWRRHGHLVTSPKARLDERNEREEVTGVSKGCEEEAHLPHDVTRALVVVNRAVAPGSRRIRSQIRSWVCRKVGAKPSATKDRVVRDWAP
jgi:hypothetical protein